MLANYKNQGKMVVQVLFDSVCQCLGAPAHHPRSRTNPTEPWPEDITSRHPDGIVSAESRKRASRLELRKNDWDEVFHDTNKKSASGGSPSTKRSQSSRRTSKTPPRTPPRKSSSVDNQNANVVVAPSKSSDKTPSSTPRRRRRSKSRGKSPDTIFRSRAQESPAPQQSKRQPQQSPSSSSFSKFLTNHSNMAANALCFATPIKSDEDDQNSIATGATSDCSSTGNTLNTAEDDTIMFEVKYGSANKKKRRPPMMLFPQFKVEEEKDELRRIVATHSHKSFSQE